MFGYPFDISVLGSEHVGKKTFANCKFLDSFFDQDYMSTIGMDVSLKKVEIDNTIVKLRFSIFSCAQYWWDGTLKGILEGIIRGAYGAIILYDVTNSKSIEQISQWIQIVKNNAGDIPILLVGNKLDLKEQREISKEQIETIENEHNLASSIEISVKTGENMEKMVSNLARMVLNSYKLIYKARIDVDEYKKRMITYINQAEKEKEILDDNQNLVGLMEKLKKTLISNTHETYRTDKVIYGYVLLIRNCYDLLKNPVLPSDKDLLQKNIEQGYKGVYEELKKKTPKLKRSKYDRIKKTKRMNIYNSLFYMRFFLGAEKTEQFSKTYNIETLKSLKPHYSKQNILYFIWITIVIIIIAIFSR